jgi:hypothetical protein
MGAAAGSPATDGLITSETRNGPGAISMALYAFLGCGLLGLGA